VNAKGNCRPHTNDEVLLSFEKNPNECNADKSFMFFQKLHLILQYEKLTVFLKSESTLKIAKKAVLLPVCYPLTVSSGLFLL